MVRFSFSYFNTVKEIDNALNAIDIISKKEG
jgi:selenocysteine lyase/cysteine desulfurase